MAIALDVARYLLHLSNEEPEPELITHLRLQKLLYYCQGWSLAMRDHPLFPDKIEAWAHGPVVANVYPIFADCGSDAIPPHEGRDEGILSRNDKILIENVWARYKNHSATALRGMTHQEAPWREARGDRSPDEPSNSEISQESMRAFFADKYEQTALPGLDLATLRRSREAFEQGHSISYEQLLAKFA